MSVNSKMTAIADKTRELVGLTGTMGLDAMAANLGTAVNACDSQAELIQQIKTALEGKAAGSNIPSAATAEFGREPIYEQAPAGKSYFNGVLLPDIPATGFESCPYMMVLYNAAGNTWLYGSTAKPYYTMRNADESLELPSGRNRCDYDPETDSWSEIQSSTSGTWCNLSVNWTVIWANFDIPNGSATAEEVYFEGSEVTSEAPVGYGEFVPGAEEYAVTDDVLNELGHQVQQHSGTYEPVSGSEIRAFVANAVDAVLNPVVEKDINFWDYDGTLLYSYTLEEVQELTELPPGPDWHEELVFSNWNWTLDGVKSVTYQVDVGALYNTVLEAAYLHISIEYDTDRTVPLVLTKWNTGTGSIDWGDGSALETVEISEATTFNHTYNETGSYVIRVSSSKKGLKLGSDTASSNVFGENTANICPKSAILKKCHLGLSVSVSQYALNRCSSMEYVTLAPLGSIVNYVMQHCDSLQSVSLPSGSSAYGFAYCYSLKLACLAQSSTAITAGQFRECGSLTRIRGNEHVKISESYNFTNCRALVEARLAAQSGNIATFQNCCNLQKLSFAVNSTGIGQSMFYGCYSLRELDIPENVTTIGAQAFYNCQNMRKIRFRSATPPSAANANAFSGLPATCIVEVPAESLEAYQNATNYASIAAQMVGV